MAGFHTVLSSANAVNLGVLLLGACALIALVALALRRYSPFAVEYEEAAIAVAHRSIFIRRDTTRVRAERQSSP